MQHFTLDQSWLEFLMIQQLEKETAGAVKTLSCYYCNGQRLFVSQKRQTSTYLAYIVSWVASGFRQQIND